MAEDFLVPIYKMAFCGADLAQIREKLEIGDGYGAQRLLESCRRDLEEACRIFCQWDGEKGQALQAVVEKIGEKAADGIGLADYIGMELLPLYYDCMALWGHIEEKEGNYGLESSRSGFLTLKNLEKDIYYHSRVNPLQQARIWAKGLYAPNQSRYTLLGGGLGYMAYALYELSDGAAQIQVFFRDGQLAEYALCYGLLSYIPESCLDIVVSEDLMDFLQASAQEGVDTYIYPPSVTEWPPEEERLLKGLVLQAETVRIMRPSIERNCLWNSRSGLPLFGQGNWHGLPRRFLVAAGGPSLDENLDWIRKNREGLAIVAVGTVFRKLMGEGIKPDFVTVLDPHRRILRQIEGLEAEDVPLLIGAQAHYGFARIYQGPKYLCVSYRDDEVAGWDLDLTGEPLWSKGGTVSYMAIEAAIRMEARQIYLAGLDLSFPGGMSHASGTLDMEKKSGNDFMQAPSADGGLVDTDATFLDYKEQIEELISAADQGIEVYNLSRSGLAIAGTKTPDWLRMGI